MKKILSKQNRVLLGELVRTDFKLRYQGSVLGYTWSLLKPLLLFAILYTVFVKFLKLGSGIPHYPIYLLLGIVIWNFFSETTSQSLVSIVQRGDLIRKIRIPRWIIVISASVSALINLGLNLIVIVVFLLLNRVDIRSTILLLPLNLLEVYIFALGVSFILAAAFVKFRDLTNIWEITLQAGFYLTPIFYPLTLISKVEYQKILLINPVAQAMQDARYNVVTDQVVTARSLYGDSLLRFVPFIIIALTLLVGIPYFKKRSKTFAEDV